MPHDNSFCFVFYYISFRGCATSTCKNGGTCNGAADGFTCTCPPGYNGTRCEIGTVYARPMFRELSKQRMPLSLMTVTVIILLPLRNSLQAYDQNRWILPAMLYTRMCIYEYLHYLSLQPSLSLVFYSIWSQIECNSSICTFCQDGNKGFRLPSCLYSKLVIDVC